MTIKVEQASKKRIIAVLINEDNAKTASLWKTPRTNAQLVYISPEMALSDSFTKLWKDTGFRKRLQVIVVDEAHCIDEWGEEFRPLYRGLSTLLHYTGQDIPFVACTATCMSRTFDICNNMGDVPECFNACRALRNNIFHGNTISLSNEDPLTREYQIMC
jgi:superfamily II DNA helicase RecQ